MNDPPTGPAAERDYERQLREMNEALLVSSVRQHELAEQAEQAAAALRESEERFRILADSAPALIWVNGPEGCEFVNRGYLEFLGVNITDVRGYNWAQFIHPDDRDDYVNAYLRAMDARTLFNVEFRFRHHDGEYRLMRSVGQPRLGSNGELLGYAGLTVDITERKRAAHALEVSESRYRRLFETSQDAILILDAHTGEITDANPFIKQMLGYSLDELVGKELWQIGFFRDKAASLAAFRELIEKGYVRYDHLPLESKNGQQVDVEFISNVYVVDKQQVIQCNIRDITERVRLERQTREQAEALADLNRRKDEFLAMLSHELRNPLAPIINAVHLLRHQKDDNPIQQQARAIIERQAGQLARIIDDLMEVSRITTGKIKLHQERLDIRGIVEQAVESIRPLIDQRKHELSVSLPDEPIWLYADAARLEQVIVNLLNNAAKYMDKGGHIWLSVEQEGDEAVLRVRDTGIGILPEILPRIFDLFTQADLSLDRSQGGLGIGLTVVQRLVGMHRGTVEANSAGVGKGSEFIVRLPVVLSPARQKESPAIETAEQPGARWRVLVADDNVDSANVTALLLRELGHETQVAYSGATTLEAAYKYQPNLVLLDIGMPEMDGYEVAERLRQHPQLRNAWVVAITGYGQEADRQRSQEAGIDYHLVKPVGAQKLQELLRMLTTQERSEE